MPRSLSPTSTAARRRTDAPSPNAMKKKRLTLSPAPPDYAAGGDLLRVLCVFMIGWYHIWQQSWLSPVLKLNGFRLDLTCPVRAGYMFVDLMLLLSGFLVYLPYANDAARPAGEFYLKRALRILPSYWFCLAVMLYLALTDPNGLPTQRVLLDLLAHLGFVHNLFLRTYTNTCMNVVLWTLAVEVQFYLVLPVLAPAFRKRPILCWAAMTGAAFSFRYLWTLPMEDTTLFVNRLPNMLDVYATGMLAAHLYVRLARAKRGRAIIAALGTLAFAAGLWGIWRLLRGQAFVSGYDLLRAGQLTRRLPMAFCGAGVLLGGSLSFRPLRALCSNRVVRWLSGVSFNFYIWHQWLAVKLKAWHIPPYTAELPNQASEQPWQLQYTLLCFAAALALAALVTYVVEKPCARLGRSWLKRLEARRKPVSEPNPHTLDNNEPEADPQ